MQRCESLARRIVKNADGIDHALDARKARQPCRFVGILGKIGMHEAKAGVACGPGRALGAHDVVAVDKQGVAHMASNEAARSRQQDTHGCPL
jgi:hypothetical protein